MKKILLPVLLYFSLICFAQNNSEKVEHLVEEAYSMDIFSGVVLIADKDKPLILKSLGYADYDNQILNKPDTKFNIGSIGKFFTQIMIMQLMQEGRLNLTDNLKKLYPLYYNEFDDKITVKQLLTFSAGLGDYFGIREFQVQPDSYRSTDALLSLIKKQPLLYEPGTSNEYSNSGYVVLGGIIEKLTGKSYEENLKERILNRLSMNNSGFIYKDSKRENTAKGFIVNPDGSKESTYERMPNVPTAAGGMYSTAEDLLKLDRSFMKDNLLLDDEYKVFLLTRFSNDINKTFGELLAEPDFGMGVAGGSPGWNAVYDQNVANKYTVLILSNFDNGAEALIDRVNSILKGEKYPPLKMDAGRFIYKIIKEKGTDDFVKNFEDYLSEYEISNDRILNRAGYQLLNKNMIDEAIALFLVNTKYFPDAANTYDSLGEAYLKANKKELAIENYKKAFAMDPQNTNAERILKELEAE